MEEPEIVEEPMIAHGAEPTGYMSLWGADEERTAEHMRYFETDGLQRNDRYVEEIQEFLEEGGKSSTCNQNVVKEKEHLNVRGDEVQEEQEEIEKEIHRNGCLNEYEINSLLN